MEDKEDGRKGQLLNLVEMLQIKAFDEAANILGATKAVVGLTFKDWIKGKDVKVEFTIQKPEDDEDE